MRDHLDLAISNLRYRDRIAEVANSVVDLDLVVKEFLEGGDVEDLITDGLGAVDCVLPEVLVAGNVFAELVVVPSWSP